MDDQKELGAKENVAVEAEYISPIKDFSVKDYEESLQNVEFVRKQIGQRILNLARDCEAWKRDCDLVWIEPAKPRKGTVYLAPDAEEFNRWIFNAENHEGKECTLIVYNPGNGLVISEYESGGGAKPGNFIQTVLIKYPKDEVELVDDPEKLSVLGVGCALASSDRNYPGREEFLYSSQPNLEHPYIFGWDQVSVSNGEEHEFKRQFIYKKVEGRPNIDVVSRALDLVGMLTSARVLGKWDRDERKVIDQRLSLPEDSS